MNAFRTEHDSMGNVRVPADKLWGAQTERSRVHFPIGTEIMPEEILDALALIKKAAAIINRDLLPEKMTDEKCGLICSASDAIRNGSLKEHFPLVVWQTGSGTQTNMNVNEVIANYGNQCAQKALLHPNDDVNLSQSSNDCFPSAMHIASVLAIEEHLLPSLRELVSELKRLEAENKDVLKIARTHLQDAVPIRFSQEISGWRANLEKSGDMLRTALPPLLELAQGGTAVGTGLNAPEHFDVLVAAKIAELTGKPFITAKNKFHALTSLDEMVFAHGALKALAADLMKMANDIRWLASGPRCGLGEITIPANEPGSSIMPGKTNPTQCEQVTMVAVQVMANDTAIGLAASQGNFQLNVFLPACAYHFLQSVRLLTDSITAFTENCVRGIRANQSRMDQNVRQSLMLGTALSPHIGYEKAARVAQLALQKEMTLREACISLGYLNGTEFDRIFHPEKMA